jgi:hypothetical protein
MAGLIPKKNWPALAGYCLGLFSLFLMLRFSLAIVAVVGLPVAIVTVVFGVMGIRRAEENPMVRGKGQAICALLVGLINLGIVAVIVVIVVRSHH